MTGLNGATPGACPTCGFPPTQPGYLRSNFPPGHAKFGTLVRCPDCHEANLSQRLAGSSQLTGWLKLARFENYEPNDIDPKNSNTAALEAAVSFAKRPVGWLTLWGTFGPGKTHLLAGVVNHCTANRLAAVYYTLPDLLDELRGSYKDDGFSDLFSRLVSVPVLAIDELDKVRLTEWAREKIYQLCDARYRDLDTRGTLFALNVEPEPNDVAMGYLYSRMHDRRCTVVEVGGGDVRPLDIQRQ